ncbi:MAG: hypothetical protein R3F37_16875 [Candidatus Competibacteraceae bacterium]
MIRHSKHYPAGAARYLSQLQAALQRYQGPRKTGELILAQPTGATILLTYGRPDTLERICRRSISTRPITNRHGKLPAGQSGTWVGLDHRNQWVLAAHGIAVLNLALINKIDLSEIRAPFVTAGAFNSIIALCLVTGGTILLFWVTNNDSTGPR